MCLIAVIAERLPNPFCLIYWNVEETHQQAVQLSRTAFKSQMFAAFVQCNEHYQTKRWFSLPLQWIYLFTLRIADSYSRLYSVGEVWFVSTCYSSQGNSFAQWHRFRIAFEVMSIDVDPTSGVATGALGAAGPGRHFADQKLIFKRSLKVLVSRYYFKCIFYRFLIFMFRSSRLLG